MWKMLPLGIIYSMGELLTLRSVQKASAFHKMGQVWIAPFERLDVVMSSLVAILWDANVDLTAFCGNAEIKMNSRLFLRCVRVYIYIHIYTYAIRVHIPQIFLNTTFCVKCFNIYFYPHIEYPITRNLEPQRCTTDILGFRLQVLGLKVQG